MTAALDEFAAGGLTADLAGDGSGSGLAVQCSKRAYCHLPEGHGGFCRKNPTGTPSSPGKPRRKKPAGPPPSDDTPRRRSSRSKSSDPSWLQAGLAFAWDAVGKQIEAHAAEPMGPPMGRVVQFEAPYAAAHLHPLLRRVPIYRRLDSVSAGLLDQLAPLIGAPLLVGLIAKDPATYGPVLEGPLVAALEPMVLAMVEAKKQRVDRMKELESLGEEGQALMGELLTELFGFDLTGAEDVDQ